MTVTRRLRLAVCAALFVGLSRAPAAPLDRSLAVRAEALLQQAELRHTRDSAAAVEIEQRLGVVISAWREVDRPSEGDYRRFHHWLDAAFKTTLPGRSVRLPAAPQFVGSPTLEQPQGVVSPVAETPFAGAPGTPTPAASLLASPSAIADRPTPRVAPTGPDLGIADSPDRSRREPRRGNEPIAGPALTAVEVAKPVIDEDRFGDDSRLDQPALRSVIGTPDRSPKSTSKPAPQRSRWSRHPSAAPLDWADPFADDPSASINPLRSRDAAEVRVVRRPAFVAASIAVDMSELTARVRGYNNAVRSLQQRLLGDPAPDAFVLADWADELERLAEERSFLDLYRGGLPPTALEVLPPSPSIDVVGELLRRRAHDQLHDADDRGDVERRALETISARVSRLQETRAGL